LNQQLLQITNKHQLLGTNFVRRPRIPGDQLWKRKKLLKLLHANYTYESAKIVIAKNNSPQQTVSTGLRLWRPWCTQKKMRPPVQILKVL